ncbi:MAG: CRISPR-associated ring nuclease Csm6 [Exilibacterium sp.]
MSAQHYRRILVAVSGMSPQIITETLYGLCGAPQRRDHPWIPHEIHLITTEDGREQARLQLLEGKCHFQQFLQDYGIVEPPHFALDTIHVIRAVDGTPLADLRTPAENEAAADFITDKIREFTCDDGTELHVSLAGGRKTMGFYVCYALSLFGRQQDRLSHVLVSPEFESLRDFFYPAPTTRLIAPSGQRASGDEKLDTAKAEVWLADIPFVRLRGFLSEGALVNRARFSEVVELVDVLASAPQVILDLRQGRLRLGPLNIPLPPQELALYLVFARKTISGEAEVVFPKSGNEEFSDMFMQAKRDIIGEWADNDRTEKALKQGMDRSHFDSVKSKLNTSLEKHLGKRGVEKYGVKSGQRGKYTYFLSLEHTDFD